MEVFMSTYTLQIPTSQAGWFEQMIRTMGWEFSRSDAPKTEPVDKSQAITPALRRRITMARKEYAAGQTKTCRTPQEMQQYFDSL